MPNISFFYGIVIYMYASEHNPPHFHAKYQGSDAEIDFDGNILNGSLPDKQLKLVQAWTVIHKEELIADWDLLQNNESAEKIEPLK